MSCLRRLIVLCLVLVGIGLVSFAQARFAQAGEPLQAAGPTYLLLRPARHGHYPGSPHLLQVQPYAYGWFGAQPSRRFRTKHYSYYGTYLQWSYR